jgi:hypothetical protein
LAFYFQQPLPRFEALPHACRNNGMPCFPGHGFPNPSAIIAQHHDRRFSRIVIGVAGKKGVAAFQPVDQPGRHQYIDDAVYGNGGQLRPARCGYTLDKVVGANRAMIAENFAEDAFPQRRKAQTLLNANASCPLNRGFYAGRMIVRGSREGMGRGDFHVLYVTVLLLKSNHGHAAVPCRQKGVFSAVKIQGIWESIHLHPR